MQMPATRKNNPLGLPPRVYAKHGGIWYVDRANKWHRLGKVWDFEARAAWNKMVSDGVQTSRLTVADLIDNYIAHGRSRWKPRTVKGYLIDAKTLSAVFGAALPSQITPGMCQRYLDTCLEEGRGVHGNREMALLSAAMNWGIPRELVPSNPAAHVKRNPEKARTRRITIEELDRFVAFARTRTRQGQVVAVVSELQFLCAQAKANILKLRKADVDAEGIHFTLSKTGVRVCVLWSERLRQAHQRAMALHDGATSLWLVPTTRWTPYTDDGYTDLFGEVMSDWIAAGNEHFKPHDLRAGGSTKLLEAGDIASNTSGHKQESTLKRHYDRRVERKGKPAA